MDVIGRSLLFFGVVLIVVGFVFIFLSKFSFKLPGDIYIQGKNYTIYIPIATSIIISLILTIVLNLLFILKR